MVDTTLNEFIKSHSLAKQLRQYKSDIVMEKFSNWLASSPSNNSWHSSLYLFSSASPFCYTKAEIIDETLKILHLDLKNSLEAIQNQREYLSRAIFAFIRPSSSWNIEDYEKISIDSPRGIESFENIWHPEYIKYSEQLYNHLIKIPLEILGKKNNKDYLSLTLANRAAKLTELGFTNLTNGYDSVIRNAISHGGVEYEITDIRYIDSKETKEIHAPESVKLLDNLFDTCSSIIAAFLIFIIENQGIVEKFGVENLPLGITLLLTIGFADHNGSNIISFIESGQNKQQLNINIKINTSSRGVHQIEALQVAWAACFFGGKNFDRFLVNIDCNKPAQPLVIINGKTLRESIENDIAFTEAVPKLFESSLLWYDASKLDFRIYALRTSFKTNWEIQKRNFRLEMIQKDNFIPRLHYKVVFFKNTSPKSFRRLEAHIILDVSKEITDTNLKKIIKSAVNRLRQKLIKRKDIHGEFGLLGFPFSITLRVFSADKRVRTLTSYSWQDKELVAIAEFSKNWKISPPFFTRQNDSALGQIRIKYNPKLIKPE